MKKEEAQNIIKITFSSEFNEENFQNFVANLFKKHTPSKRIVENHFIKESFKSFILKYKIAGSFVDNEGNSIDILEVILNKNTSLERARTAQRNFVAEYLKSNNKEASLVAFISPKNKDWRLSLVKLEHSLEVVDDKLKSKEEITPARRWSFLVGENEGSHTAQSRFINLLMSDDDPNLKELELAFDIETVTKEFFDKYTQLFFTLKEHLDELLKKDNVIREDFKEKEISTVDFAKKTLGQIVFLYFLQKKGWFGVAPDKQWGEGPKRFIRNLFERREKYGKNFFNDILEPLFYEALAQDRGTESIYPRLNNCRMPFLNGGLFEPMNDYKWETTNILIPDEIFSNTIKTKAGDIGTGILDVFDRYNFTVNENEPLEKEVAVDPEMLGKVFENLLDIKDRKSKGAFYTPREIVHYMCQESLINYLDAETNNEIPRNDLELFIQKGDRIIENDKIALARQEERIEKYGSDKYQDKTYSLLLPELIRTKAEILDKLLQNIKVADPAVGSGAFPLGMINEIVRARKVLNIYLDKNLSDYQLKRYTITHSIYGVDIDIGAVEIAKLRLWLALVVDEKTPHPLPNLEHKIMQGNSLISEYEGIKLFDESIFENKETPEQLSLGMGKTDSELKMEELRNKTNLFIEESQKSKKQKLKEEIDNLKWEFIEVTLKEQEKVGKLKEIKKFRKTNTKPFFIWKLEFSDVFKEKGGFDVVIGNPPYVGEKGNKEIFRLIAKGNLGKYYHGQMDLFYFFFHLALDLGRPNTQNAFITTNYYITARGARNLRADLKGRSSIRNLINFNELRIFESALGQHNIITIFSKGQDEKVKARTCITKRTGTASEKILKKIVSEKDKETECFSLGQKSLYDGEENYIRLAGVGNFDNPLGKILQKVKANYSLLGIICNVNVGLYTGADKVTQKHIDEYNLNLEKNSGIFILSNNEVEDLKLNQKEREYIVPLFKNSDIYKYNCIYNNNLNLLNVSFPLNRDLDLKTLPNIFNHINKFEKILKGRKSNDNGLRSWVKNGYWWGFTIRQLNFNQPKIVAPQRSKTNTFGYNEIPWYAASDVFFITSKENSEIELKYILALLNSKLYYQWLYHRGKRKGQTLELIAKPLSEIPIKEISPEDQKPFIDLVDQILEITSTPYYNPKNPPVKQKELEKQIDNLVYKLYGLTDEEIKIVEEKNEK